MKKITWIWLASLAGVFLYLFLTYNQLPEEVASHFDSTGRPNGYQTKTGYLSFVLCFTLFMNGVTGGLYFFLAQIPTVLMRIPWKAYWLSTPDRIQGLHQRFKSLAVFLGIFMNLVFLFTEQMVYQTNVPDAPFKIAINVGMFLISLGILALLAFSLLLFRPPAAD